MKTEGYQDMGDGKGRGWVSGCAAAGMAVVLALAGIGYGIAEVLRWLSIA